MRRAIVPLVLLAAVVAALVALVPTRPVTSRAGATPTAAPNSIVGTWLVRETLPRPGTEPPLFFVLLFQGDGTVSATAFSDGLTAFGTWRADPDGAVTFTVVGPAAGGQGVIPDAMTRLRGTVIVAPNGDALTGGYTIETVPAAGSPFAYTGPLGGERVAIEPPDPRALDLATQAAATPVP